MQDRHTGRQTDRQTNTQTDRHTDRVCRSHSPQTVTINTYRYRQANSNENVANNQISCRCNKKDFKYVSH